TSKFRIDAAITGYGEQVCAHHIQPRILDLRLFQYSIGKTISDLNIFQFCITAIFYKIAADLCIVPIRIRREGGSVSTQQADSGLRSKTIGSEKGSIKHLRSGISVSPDTL